MTEPPRMHLHMLLHLTHTHTYIPLNPTRHLSSLFLPLRPRRPHPVHCARVREQAERTRTAAFLATVALARHAALRLVDLGGVGGHAGAAPALAAVFGAGENVPGACAVGDAGGAGDEGVSEGVGG